MNREILLRGYLDFTPRIYDRTGRELPWWKRAIIRPPGAAPWTLSGDSETLGTLVFHEDGTWTGIVRDHTGGSVTVGGEDWREDVKMHEPELNWITLPITVSESETCVASPFGSWWD